MPNHQQIIDPLEQLRSLLRTTFIPIPKSGQGTWTDDAAIRRMISQVRAAFDISALPSDPGAISAAVAAFRRSGTAVGFRNLKYACLGASNPDERGCSLIAEEGLREKLFAAADAAGDTRRQIKCFQALLRSYWTFPLYDESTNAVAIRGFRALGTWLECKRRSLDKMTERKPDWMAPLAEHSNLLGADPCGKYGPALLQGDTASFRSALETLAIPTDSWILQEAIYSQMRTASRLRDDNFKAMLDKLLPIVTGKTDMFIPQKLQTRCMALLVSRYSRCAVTTEHMALRDAAVSIIGNPWLCRVAWDSDVVDSMGRPDDRAREMINGWLKRRLIGDFFELLSVEGRSDPRRLDYWLRFESFIEDMWFALGSEAQNCRSEAFKDFQHRARGRLLNLTHTTANNNAFIMRIGEYLAIEFGAKGNAFYLVRWDSIPATLLQNLLSGNERSDVSIHGLKHHNHICRLIHTKNTVPTWEQNFDNTISSLIGRRPEEPARKRD
ncbi:MAG: hypothetical protein EKK69_04795 [Candidatus Competibacteraceae bacterium]|nr:MAG: hypothetical protein EKK69_04795 [Candidatus Competibacteraceae bacterium]